MAAKGAIRLAITVEESEARAAITALDKALDGVSDSARAAAKDVLNSLDKQIEGYGKATGAVKEVEQAFRKLGVKSEEVARQQRQAYITAFEKIKNSGTASAAEISRAQKALEAQLARIDKQLDKNGNAFVRLKAPPFYDSLFVAAENADDPAEVIDARAAHYHWHRATHELTLSSLLEGGHMLDLDQAWLADTLQQDVTEPPFRRVSMRVVAEWEQRVTGTRDLTVNIKNAFSLGLPNTLTGEDFRARWPRTGDAVGGNSGYQVTRSAIKEVFPDPFFYPQKSAAVYGATSVYTYPDPEAHAGALSRLVQFKRYYFDVRLVVAYQRRQRRQEVLTFVLHNDAQDLAFDQGAEKRIDITLQDITVDNLTPDWRAGTFYAVGSLVLYGAYMYKCLIAHTASAYFYNDYAVPPKWQYQSTTQSALQDVARNSFFTTARGRQAFEHALMIARAQLAASTRCVELRLQAPLTVCLDLTCDHSVRIASSDLPGGAVTAKTKAYRLVIEGETGTHYAELTLAAAVGTGAAYAPGSQDGDYVDLDYDGGVYQVITGEAGVPGAAYAYDNLVYEEYANQAPPNDLGDVLLGISIVNSYNAQMSHLQANQYPSRDDLNAVLEEKPTTLDIRLAELTGQEVKTHTINVTITHPWAGPKQIDLGAS